tara:strand:+ start:497 stop:655 length:159 start_codon:yes stop_codon:yes gene_type:complete
MTNRTKRLRKKRYETIKNWRDTFDGYLKGAFKSMRKRKGGKTPPSQTQMNTD